MPKIAYGAYSETVASAVSNFADRFLWGDTSWTSIAMKDCWLLKPMADSIQSQPNWRGTRNEVNI
jgi:hypothetical protein